MRYFEIFLFNIPLEICERVSHLQAATTATTLLTSAISGNRGHVLDAADLQARARESAESRLAARAGALRLVATRRAHLDVERGEPELLQSKKARSGRKQCALVKLLVTCRNICTLFPQTLRFIQKCEYPTTVDRVERPCENAF